MTDPPPTEGELILYRTAQDAVRVEVLYESETFWLDQRRMAELFGVDVRTVSEHLRTVYGSGELIEEATLRKIRMVRTEGSREVARDNATPFRRRLRNRHRSAPPAERLRSHRAGRLRPRDATEGVGRLEALHGDRTGEQILSDLCKWTDHPKVNGSREHGSLMPSET